MKQTPFTTRSGVRIGSMYEAPKRYESSGDMERLQTALLGRDRPLSRLVSDWSGYLWFFTIVLGSLVVASCNGGLK